MTKRIFVSIDLPTAVKDYLGSVQNRQIYWIKWMTPKNFHITISFLGDLERQEIEEAAMVLQDAASSYQPFHLSLSGTRSERDMLWVVPEHQELLTDLQTDLRLKLKERHLGKREKRHFAPHILLGKSKTGRRMSWEPENFQAQEFLVTSVNLYESQLTPGLATHILLKSFTLGS